MLNFAQMSVDYDRVTARSSSRLAVPVGTERRMLHPASHTSLFQCFPCGGISMGCILVHAAFGKRPMTVPGAHQQELQFTVAQPITNSRHVNAREI